MITAGLLAGSLVSLALLQGVMGRVGAVFLVATMMIGALFGAHLAHRLLHSGLSGQVLYGTLEFWKDGHSLFGAFAFCALLLLALARIARLPFWRTADAFAVGVPAGLFFARIGCYMKGCCWGTPIGEAHLFHGLSEKLIRNELLTVHPVQLYSAAAALAIFCFLLAFRRRDRTPGLLTGLFLLLYPAARFFLEFLRGDSPAILGGLSLNQWISVLLFLAGSVVIFLRLRETRYEGSDAQRI
jgi:phosphatidylglycerol:prolipoprotein diacylglycerol transferase